MKIPCGQCMGCRLERCRQWAVRCMHEASLYSYNCFLTLTYDDEHLPKNGSLVLDDYQLFMKRAREYVRAKYGIRLRFYGCGEYGELERRPHYHILLLNFNFEDRRYFGKTPSGFTQYRSAKLEDLWPHGYATIGGVSFESAGYVAQYCLKKITGKDAASYYDGRLPEFGTMSRRPGIGRPWFDKYGSGVYPDDFVLSRGFKAKPPRYYDKVLEATAPDAFSEVKIARRPASMVAMRLRDADNTPERLAVKAEITSARMTQLRRVL